MNKIQRNDQCPCGSGKKYKKCCLLDEEKNSEIIRASLIAGTHEEMKQILNEPANAYVLKVELLGMRAEKIDQKVSRTFEISGKSTLYDFHMAIQHGFDWDNDHMFSFYLGKNLYDKNTEYSANPYGEHMDSGFGQSSKPAGEAQLRDLKLSVGFSFWYLFDFGDELIHKVTVKEVKKLQENNKKYLKIIASTGDNVPQYENWDEE